MVTLLLILLIVQALTGLVLAGTDIYYPPFEDYCRHSPQFIGVLVHGNLVRGHVPGPQGNPGCFGGGSQAFYVPHLASSDDTKGHSHPPASFL